jgi:hypothetical protein
MGYCELGNETSSHIKDRARSDKLRDSYLFKKDPTPCGYTGQEI